jgi:two-component system, LytTR family, sensor kinase
VGSSPDDARTVVTGLADILRYALESDRREYVRLEEECAFVQQYLAIEKIRFGNRLHTYIELAPEVRQCLLPPMILQPLVENAVKHGIAPKEEGGTVRISIRRDGGFLALNVSDDGLGMVNMPALNLAHGGRGLAYTDARLRKMFGEESGLRMESSAAGTTFFFHIPEIVPSVRAA